MTGSAYVWWVIAAGALVTIILRYTFIGLEGKINLPPLIRRALRFVPAAVLPTLIVPAVLLPEGVLAVSVSNYRLLAALVAGLVAWRTRNIILTLAVALGALYLLQMAF